MSGTSGTLDDSDFQQATDASSLSHCLQLYRVTMAMPLILQPDELLPSAHRRSF